ncbi:MAG: hypothetical protein BGO69_03100 [Bacteroidetes bacterium 46-16]|nr:MAG: hypothetical protein BGO69_03100 [Bacteroidetes bacterium 46-16]
MRREPVILLVCALFFPLVCFPVAKNKTTIIAKIDSVINSLHANIGIAVTGLDFSDSIFINANKHYPMQSVYKFPLALFVLDKVDKGQLSLEMNVHTARGLVDKDTWSPMVKDFPGGDINMTLRDLLTYAISKSDNNACDILFRTVGGTAVVQKYLDGIGIKGINIAATEAEMKKAFEVQYSNWAEPVAMAHLLKMFYDTRLLSKDNTNLLMRLMTQSENPDDRIKGRLPPGTVVAHKTGTSGTSGHGIRAATNDIGIITLPGHRHIAVVIFVSDYKAGLKQGEQAIAEIAKLVWDYYVQ